MIEESYVSFDTAKMLKEAGFDCNCRKWYSQQDNDVLEWEADAGCNWNVYNSDISRPTQALAARWLRDVYNLHISTEPYAGTWHWVLWNVNGTFIANSATKGKEDFETCEEAIEDALQEAIKLIKK